MNGLPRPTTKQPQYGEHLGDAAYWGPYVLAALDRHGIGAGRVEPLFVGTFPTFAVGERVVKLFGDAFDGGDSFAAELAMNRLLSEHKVVAVPALLADGRLYDSDNDDGDGSGGWTWPYLIFERLDGAAIRETSSELDDEARMQIASDLGEAVGGLHSLPPPPEVANRDLIGELRRTAPERMARFGLPPHLAAQVADFMSDASDELVLVHADITADHVFVKDGSLQGIIDWGDAICADRSYELVALFFDAFDARADMRAAFLQASAWPVGPDFPKRALQGVLEFQFDAIGRIASLVDLDRVTTLVELADRLFA